jgi:hypothetical protein
MFGVVLVIDGCHCQVDLFQREADAKRAAADAQEQLRINVRPGVRGCDLIADR